MYSFKIRTFVIRRQTSDIYIIKSIHITNFVITNFVTDTLQVKQLQAYIKNTFKTNVKVHVRVVQRKRFYYRQTSVIARH